MVTPLLERALARPVPAATLAAVRAAFGAYLVVYALSYRELFANNVAVRAAMTASGTASSLPATVSWLPLDAAWLGDWFPWLHAGFTLAAVLLAVGLCTRVAAACVCLGMLVATTALRTGLNGGDQAVYQATFALLLAALPGYAQAAWSLDTRLRPRAARATVPVWPLRLLQLEAVMVYAVTGMHKLASQDWYRGEALYYVLANPTIVRFDLGWLARSPVAVGALTYGTLAFELALFPLLIWVRRARPALLAAGVALHLGIVLTMRIPVFSEVMLLLYLAFREPARA